MPFDPTTAEPFEETLSQPAGLGVPTKRRTASAFDPSSAIEDEGANQGVIGTLKEGAKSAGRAIGATADTYLGDEQAVVESAQLQQEAPKAQELQDFYSDVQTNKADDSEDAGVWEGIKNVGSAVIDNPKGAGLAVVEQLPNAVPALAGGWAGMKAGAAAGGAIGTVVPGVGNVAGATVGGVVGGLAGMFLGNAAIETGHKAMSAAEDGTFGADEQAQVQREGATKAAVITGVDALTLGLGGKVAASMHRTGTAAVEAATRKALVDNGIDVADEAAVLAARSNPEISAAVRAAQENAVKVTDTFKRRATEAGTLLGMETVGEGLGEYLGELAATGKADVTDAVLEAAMSLGQSGVEAAWNMSRTRDNRNLWEPASQVQPQPTPENPAPAPVQRPNPNAGPLSAAANLLPAPESDGTLYGDAAGNVSGNRPSWVNPENDPGRQSFGPGMDRQTVGGVPGFRDKPLEGELQNLAGAGMPLTAAASQRQPQTFENDPPRLTDGRQQGVIVDADGNAQLGKLPNNPPADYVQGGRGMDQQAPVGKRFGNELAARNAVAKAAQPDTLEVVSVGPKEFEVRAKAPVLQNRDRSTPASITQMREIAARPDYSRLGFSRDFANGAPVVEPGANVSAQQLGRQDVATTGSGRKIPVQYAVVEAASLMPSHDANGTPDQHYATGMKSKSRAIAGNGRVAGLRQAFAQGTATEYVEQLAGDTSLHGISPTTIRSMKEPVLVRIMPREEITQDIGDESNTTGVSALSGAEQAMNDARRINIDDMEFSASGEISETTVRQFVQSMPKAEQGGLLDGSRPSRQAYDRAESAIFANAYESESLIRLQAQATDPEVRTVLSGLLMAAPKMARLKGAGAWDIRGLVVEAAEAAVNARRNGQTLEQFAKQIDLDRNPESQYFIELFAANIRSAKRIGDELSAVAELFYAEASKAETDMFGAVPRRSRQELLNGADNANTDRTPADPQATGNQAGPGAAAPGSQAQGAERAEPAGAAAAAQPESFQLDSYSEEELAAQAAAQAEAAAKAAAADKAAADKVQADRDRNDFTLTGSDRPSDVAAARGQNDMFAPPTRGEKKAQQEAAKPSSQKPDRQQSIADAQAAAAKVLSQGGTEADANRAATDLLIERMADDPSIAIATDAPAAVQVAKLNPLQQAQKAKKAGIEAVTNSLSNGQFGATLTTPGKSPGTTEVRQLMAKPDGGYYWGDWYTKKHRDLGILAGGRDKDGTPAYFATKPEAIAAALDANAGANQSALETQDGERTAAANSTAPEHLTVGVDDRELAEIVDEFNAAQQSMQQDGERIHHLFDAPEKKEIVRLADKAKVYHAQHGWMTVDEAKAKIQEWKKHAAAQGDSRENADKVVLSLFDKSGAWSRPWEEAGYQVYRFDIQDDPEVGDVNNFSTDFFGDWFGDFEGNDIYAILAACPCTDFAVSGARHFAAKDADGRTVASVNLVHQTLRTIEYFRPAVWAVENPVGRIEKLGGLPPWRLAFDPNHLGDPYTKKTLIWGRFNGDLPVAPVEPTEGSKMHKLYGGKSIATKNARSVTPEGFAYGFFMANNAIDHPVMAISNKYDRLDRGLIEQAVSLGMKDGDIADLVDDFYYMDLDDEGANDALREAIAERKEQQPQALPESLKDLTIEQIDTAFAALAAGPEEQFFEGFQRLRSGNRDHKAHIDKLFDEVAYFYVDAKGLLGAQAQAVVKRLEGDTAKRDLMDKYKGDLAGLQLSNKAGTQFALFLPDASEPGRFRASFFDARGFYGHSTRDTYQALLDEAFQDGYREEAPGKLEALAGTEAFAKGNELVGKIQAVNAGRMTWGEFVEQSKAAFEPDAAVLEAMRGAVEGKELEQAAAALRAYILTSPASAKPTIMHALTGSATETLNASHAQVKSWIKKQVKAKAKAKAAPARQPIRFTSGQPASDYLADGSIIEDGQGQQYRVHYQRNDLVLAHPIIDGNAQVNAESGVRFHVGRPESADGRRTDPIYLVQDKRQQAQGVADQLASMNLDDLSALIDEISEQEATPQTAKPKAQRSSKAKTSSGKPRVRSTTSKAERTDTAKPDDVSRSAGEIAKSLGVNMSSAGMNALEGLTKLFGGPGRLNSGLSFDEETYAKAKPFFAAAMRDIEAAGKDLRDFIRALLSQFGDGVKPYILRYAQDIKQEQDSVYSGERVGADSSEDAGQAAGGNAGSADAGAVGSADGSLGQGESGQQRSDAAAGVSGRGAAAQGERSDKPVDGSQPGMEGSDAGSADGGRGNPDSTGGLFAERDSDAAIERAIEGAVTPAKANVKPSSKPGTVDEIKAQMPFLTDGQAEDVAFAERRLSKPDGYGVLYTNGTGTGKTFSGLGIAARAHANGKTSILIVVPKQPIADAWVKAGEKFFGLPIKTLESTKDNGGSGVVVTTYANLGDNPSLALREWDMVVADEAHYLSSAEDGKTTRALDNLRALTKRRGHARDLVRMRESDKVARLQSLTKEIDQADKELAESGGNANFSLKQLERDRNERDALNAELNALYEKEEAAFKAMKPEDAPRGVFLSATPFAYEKNVQWAQQFLFDWGTDEGNSQSYNAGGPFERFMIQHFGYRMRYNKLTEPDAKVDRGLMQRAFNAWLKREGALSGRALDSAYDYDRLFVTLESPIGKRVDEALKWLWNRATGRDLNGNDLNMSDELKYAYRDLSEKITKENFNYHARMYFLEALKAREIMPHIRAHLALGRKVLVMHDFKQGGAVNPFILSAPAEDEHMKDAIDAFSYEFSDLQQAFSYLPSPITQLTKAFPDALVYNGNFSAKKRLAMQDAFNSDDPDAPRIMIAQGDAMREGVSIHDTTGAHQRAMIHLGMPVKPTASIQQEGRTYRTGQASDAIFRYFTIGTAWERAAYAEKIARRAGAAENLAMGELARGLQQAFIDAYENADLYEPGFDGEGKGGKASDRAMAALLTPWDSAKSFYFGTKTQGKGRSSKGREGKDYFATPEPVGLKMVEWADIRTGESVLEPSAGHGAIARWFPEGSKVRVIEQSAELASRAALRVDGEVVHGRFEDHHIVNKYDAIVMNPPFGLGGAEAIPHLAKAADHLREGGRVVALIPTGPAADKKFDNWFYALDKNGKSQRPELHLIADIKLPGVTFERAGTNTPTRIVIIEKVSGEQAEQLQPARQRDLSSATDIGELFDRLEHMEMPARLKPVEQEAEQTAPAKSVENKPVKVGEVDTWGAKHTKTGAELFMAKPAARLSNEEYKRISSLAKQHNGYWSKFGKPGFLFASEQDRAAFVEAVKGSSAAEVNEEGARYTAGTGSAPQMLREPTASEDGYETDLFGNPVSAAARKNRPARSGRAAVQRDVQPAAGVPVDTPTPAGEYSVRTIIGSEVSRRLGTDRINSAADLAQATQYLHRSAVERLDGIVTDRNGKPLAVVGGFKGAIDSASVYPATILGEAVRVPGAANIWFSHNHPSGNSELSNADRHLFTRLADVFEGSGIEPGGLIAVGRGEFSATDGSKGAIPAGGRIVSVPAIEREQVGEPLQQTVTSPAEAMEIAAASYSAAKAPGILLLNSKHAVTGWTPIAKAMIDGPLRHTGQLNAIYRAISEGNPGAAILVHGGELDAALVGAHDAANNIAAAIAKAEVRVLDVINVKTKRSRAEKGEQIVGNTLYRLNPGKTKGLPLFSAKGIAKKLQSSMGLRVEAVADESQLPEAVRAQIQRDGVSGRVAGVYHNGTSYLIASNLHDTKHAISTVLHEAVGHGGVKAVLGKQIGQVMRSIYQDMPAAIRNELERRYAGQLAGMSREAGQELVAEEYVAHLAEHDPRNNLLDRVVALVKQFIRQVFGADAAGKWTRADVVQLLAEAKKAAAGRGPNGGGSRYRSGAAADDGPAMPEVGEASEAEFVASLQGTGAERAFASAIYKARGTQSPFFQRWFGNSRMVNKEGRPMTFVHRSFGERDTFDDAGLGGNTGTATAALGHYLARTDVGNVERYGPVTERFYIRMEKPKVITQDQFEAMGDWSLQQVKAYRKTLMDQGYDGLYITGLAWPVVFEGKNIKAVRNVGTFDDSSNTRYAAQLQTETPAFRRWFGDSKVVDAEGKPLVVYHGTARDFSQFDTERLGDNTRAESGELGFFFTAKNFLSDSYAEIAARGGWAGKTQVGNPVVYPVYLSIQNPKQYETASEFYRDADAYKGRLNEWRAELEAQGFDGVVVRDDFEEVIAFYPKQIKSAIGNNGDFDPGNSDIRYSLNGDAATREALRKMGLGGESDAGLIEKIRNLTWGDLKAKISSMATRAEEGLFDGLVGIKRAEEAVGVNDPNRQGYVSARLATGLADVMHAVLHYGAPEWRDGIIQRRDGTKGVLEILAGLGQDNLQAWLGWLGGKRGQMLKAEGRENNLSDTDIAELLAMGRGKEELFERVYREYAAVNEAVLDLAEGAGLIDPTAREKWATEYYVPFYRQSEAEGIFTGPRTKRGLSHQTAAIKKLKGGELPTNDLLVNILSGWTKRIDASMKNKALLETVDNLKGTDYLADEGMRWTRLVVPRAEVAKKIKGDRVWLEFWAEQLGMDETANHLQVAHELNKLDDKGYEELWGRVAPTDPDIIRVQRGGKNEFYRVKDDSLLRGLKFIEGSTFNDPITRIGRTFKRMLTTGVTASPDFILRNFIRDAAHAWTINKDGFTFGVDSIKGMRKAFAEDEAYRDLMFGGASFQGGYIHGTDPEASADIIRRALAKKGLNRSQQDSYLGSLVDTPAKAGAMLRTAWEKYRELGDKVENANRLSTYTAALEAGKSKRQAAFEAKDLMDFSMRGNFAAAQWFTDVVPFLNARAQGLYKLGRAMKGDKTLIAKEVAMKGGYLALFSLLLAAANGDDERYKQLADWDKDANWHLWFSDDQVQPFRIPKPFELGLLFGTLPERLLHAATGTQDSGDLGKAIVHGVFQTLAFNPVPQFYQPIREVQANRNFFFDMPIEDMSDEGKLPEARYDERTSALGRSLGQITGPTIGVSPKQLDHLVRGYTGTLGGYVLSASNLIAGIGSDAARPAATAGDIPLVKVLYAGDGVKSTQYQTDFYDMLQEVEQLHRTVRSYAREGKVDEARELFAENRDKLRHRPALGFARQQLGNVRKQMDAVYRNTTMSAAEKREKLNTLQARANTIARRVSELAGEDF